MRNPNQNHKTAAVVAAILITISLADTSPLNADPKALDTKDIAVNTSNTSAKPDKDWTLEAGSGVTWSNVRASGYEGYTIIPSFISASLKLTDVSNDQFCNGIFRGNAEFFFRLDGAAIVHGPESHYESLLVGPRYNFVQPNSRFIPYVEAGVGLLFADSNPRGYGLGQDFNFTFTTGAGVKYLINDDWFVRVGAEYQHISNAGLSEPQHPNNPIDAVGPKISVGFSF